MKQFTQFSLEDKIKYYRKRVNDKSLTESQRNYAKRFLKKYDNNYFTKLNYHRNRMNKFDYNRPVFDKKSFQINFSTGYVDAYDFINTDLSLKEIEKEFEYHFNEVNKISKNKYHDYDKEYSKGFLASIFDYVKYKEKQYNL